MENDEARFFEEALQSFRREMGEGTPQPSDGERLFEEGFEKLEELGAGGSGRVWRARDRALDKEVALKVLDVPALTREKREQFLREARTLATLDHPNIVRIFRIDEDEGEIRICLELVKGRTLEALVREQGPLSADEAARVGIDLCRALAAIHAEGLIHGDVKHSNVMRAEGGRIVLLDFGLSRGSLPDKTAEPAAPARGGTPLFMAPELFRGENGEPRSDLFSLGVLLYWLVSGDYPFELGPGRPISPGRAVPLRDRRADLPSGFVRIVSRLIAASPGERFPSAGAVEGELLAFQEGGSRSPARRRMPWLLASLTVSGLALVVWLLVLWAPRERVVFSGAREDVVLVVLREGERVVLEYLDPVLPSERMQLEVRPERDCHVYLLNEDLAGRVFLLFPDPQCELQNPLRSGTEYVLPGKCAERNPYYLSSIPSGGRDRLLLVESPTPLPWIHEELARWEEARPATAAAGGADVLRGLEIERPGSAAPPSDPAAGLFPFLFHVQRRLDSSVRTWTRELATR